MNPEEAKTAIEKWFASIIGTLSLNNAGLEKQLNANRQMIQQLTASEVVLMDRIQDLEDELTTLKSEPFELGQAAEAEKTLLSPEMTKIAAAGKAVIQDVNEGE